MTNFYFGLLLLDRWWGCGIINPTIGVGSGLDNYEVRNEDFVVVLGRGAKKVPDLHII